VVVEETGCRFAVDVTAPLGSDSFPDLRLGRDSVTRRAAERRVLNLFPTTVHFPCAQREPAPPKSWQ